MSSTPAKTKILYCITKSVWGGAQRYIYDLATALPKHRFEMVVVSGGQGPLFHKLEAEHVRTISIASLERDINPVGELRAFFALLSLSIKEKPDILHLNSSKMGVTGALAGKLASLLLRKKIRVIFTAHGWAFNEDRSRIQKKLLYFFVRISALLQDQIITINTRDYESSKVFIPLRKLALIFNGIPETQNNSRENARNHMLQRIKVDHNPELIIGTVAELTKNKGLPYLISALRRLNNLSSFHTVIVGDGEDREMLNRQIEEKNLGAHVTLAGFLPDAARYISAFDIFVLPSVKEGLPYVILEAMFAGVPVVATDVGGVPDLVSHKKTGFLVPAKNPAKLAHAIERLAKDRRLRENFSVSAQKALKEKFDFNAMIKKTAALYTRAPQ